MRSRSAHPLKAHRWLLGLTVSAALLALLLSGCSTGSSSTSSTSSPSSSSASYPVTIKHAFGETVIEKQPQRPATLSWVNDDVSLALGVVPVAIQRSTWGGDQEGLTPWKREKLEELGAAPGSDKAPALYTAQGSEVNFTEIAKAQPDVILAAYSGISQEDYDKLSKIAPVVAYPEKRYGTSWQDSTKIIGQALGKPQDAAKIVSDTEQLLKDKASQYPQIAGKTFIAANLEAKGGLNIYTPQDNRSRLLSQLGMTVAPVVVDASKDTEQFYVEWSKEKANELDSQIFFTWLAEGMTTDSVKSDPLLGQIPAIQSGGLVASNDKTETLAISGSSPLSLPWVIDRLLPQLATAANGGSSNTGASSSTPTVGG